MGPAFGIWPMAPGLWLIVHGLRRLWSVVTVCGHAHESCPVFPGQTRVVHAGFEDPPRLTKDMPDGEAKLEVYRRVRDEIRAFVQTLPDSIREPSGSSNPKQPGGATTP